VPLTPNPDGLDTPKAVFEAAKVLIDAWCDRRELRVLKTMLDGYLSLNGLTDGWVAFYDALRNVRAFHAAGLPLSEQSIVEALIRATERIVYRNVPPGGDLPRGGST
jgi:replicative superfamily II helicase